MNIVFSHNGENAWINDLDLAGKENTPYHDYFNYHNIQERHPSAIAGKPRKKEHDCYALSVIMNNNRVPNELVKQVEDGKDRLSDY